MTHAQFIKKWIGKSYEETPGLGVQCVGGAKLYAKERGWNIGSFGGSAWNRWRVGLPFDSSWTRIEYKPGLFPPEGALVFFSEKRCKNGHVAICGRFCNKDILRSVDQNGGGKGEPFTYRFSDYKNVVGWMIHN